MTARAEHDHRAIIDALRAVLDADPGDAGRPGRLRIRLEAVLGVDEAHRLRRLVHQVVSASEDNLPVDLVRIAPLTRHSLHRLAEDLAEHRGWSAEAARRTTRIWASALGFEELAESSWPREPEASGPATPGLVLPTVLPEASRALGLATPAQPSAPAAAPSWPATPRTIAASARGLEAGWAATLGYSGLPLIAVVSVTVVLTVALCVPVVTLGATGGILALVGFALASVLVRRLGYGILVASPSGLAFTPYDGALRRERPDDVVVAPWSEVGVTEGLVSRLDLAGHRVQVGPRNRAFVRAAAGLAGRAV